MKALRQILDGLEWCLDDPQEGGANPADQEPIDAFCPWCKGHKPSGHDDCDLYRQIIRLRAIENHASGKFKLKPKQLEAFQLTSLRMVEPMNDWPLWVRNAYRKNVLYIRSSPGIEWRLITLRGVVTLQENDWVVQDLDGGLWPVPHSLFELMFEAIGGE